MPAPPTTDGTTAFQKTGLVVFGIMLGLALSELGLQLLRAGNLASHGGTRRTDLENATVVYAIGDSHTWGWNVHAHTQAYPVRLEVRLNDGDPTGPHRVVNHGFPGFNTAQALARLRAAWAEHPPDLVVLLAGFNDGWNPQDPGDQESRWVLPRLFRLLRLNWGDSAARPDSTEVVVVDGEPHYRNEAGDLIPVRAEDAREDLLQGDDHRVVVEAGLRAMIDLCRERGVPVILQTYLSEQNDRFRSASQAARNVASELDVPLADHALEAKEEGVDLGPLLQPDGHPTSAGCDRMAESLWKLLQSTGIGASLPKRQGPSTAPWIPIEGDGPHRRDDGSIEFPLRGPAHGAWQLVLSAALHPADQTHPIDPRIRLAVDALFGESQAVTYGLKGAFDSAGVARAYLYPGAPPNLAPGTYYAQAFLPNPYASGLDDAFLDCSEVWTVEIPD